MDLTGQTFNDWYVLSKAEDKFTPSGRRNIMWYCQCKCGNKKDVNQNTLIKGTSKSCGKCGKPSKKLENLIGKKFGKLTVISRAETVKKITRWNCKCDCGNETIVNSRSLKTGHTKSCGKCYSFAQWGIDNLGEDFLDKYWDWEMNTVDPWKISYGSGLKVYIKCQDVDYHKSYKVHCNRFVNGSRCSYCYSRTIHPKDSFAQYLIDTYGEDALKLYWDYDKNKKDPFNISKNTNNIIWIICQNKEYHKSYKTTTASFYRGSRCPYCNTFASKKVHKLDSLGFLYPEVHKYWSDKNKKSPYEYAPFSQKKVYWKCPDGKHEDYLRDIGHSTIPEFKCPQCNSSKGENKIDKTLTQYNIPHELQYKFKDLRSKNKKLLKFDSAVFWDKEKTKIRMLIEYDGEQHFRPIEFFGGLKKFEQQVKNDIIKNLYCAKNNIQLIRIPYWEFDNIEEILERELNNTLSS